MTDCIFCKIANKDVDAEIVYEDENVLAFLDANPISPGHSLVIPKMHFENIFEVPESVLSNTILGVKKVAMALGKMSNGVNVGQNNGRAAGQVVDHIHFHVIPRYEKDGLKHWPGKDYDKKQAEKLMKEISKEIREEEENP